LAAAEKSTGSAARESVFGIPGRTVPPQAGVVRRVSPRRLQSGKRGGAAGRAVAARGNSPRASQTALAAAKKNRFALQSRSVRHHPSAIRARLGHRIVRVRRGTETIGRATPATLCSNFQFSLPTATTPQTFTQNSFATQARLFRNGYRKRARVERAELLRGAFPSRCLRGLLLESPLAATNHNLKGESVCVTVVCILDWGFLATVSAAAKTHTGRRVPPGYSTPYQSRSTILI